MLAKPPRHAPVSPLKRCLTGAVGIEINRGSSPLGSKGAAWAISRESAGSDRISMGRVESRRKRLLLMRAKKIARVCVQSGKPLVIERLNLRKRKLERESVDPVCARLLFFLRLAPRRSTIAQVPFVSRRSRGDRSRTPPTRLWWARSTPGAGRASSSYQGVATCVWPAEGWVSRKARRCGRW
ncbi:hypothetical protein MPNT_10116 [Candidatus Methylacidithermus pantelleriae]|uniref:Uncharacterized protein n=1 Tax=Candidatus Methylacidithermus pantelleriae TaxID=2744239 RepID=A0A8J2BJ72_9BACT|nr:hypothetical protein MPNT_10116 [Candidatus Methylacidithermus pantelleriae]